MKQINAFFTKLRDILLHDNSKLHAALFYGRMNRLTFLISYGLQLIYIQILNQFYLSLNPLIYWGLVILLIYWFAVCFLRRLHDTKNKRISDYEYYSKQDIFKPDPDVDTVGVQWYQFLFAKGDKDTNMYGPAPKKGIDVLLIFGFVKKAKEDAS